MASRRSSRHKARSPSESDHESSGSRSQQPRRSTRNRAAAAKEADRKSTRRTRAHSPAAEKGRSTRSSKKGKRRKSESTSDKPSDSEEEEDDNENKTRPQSTEEPEVSDEQEPEGEEEGEEDDEDETSDRGQRRRRDESEERESTDEGERARAVSVSFLARLGTLAVGDKRTREEDDDDEEYHDDSYVDPVDEEEEEPRDASEYRSPKRSTNYYPPSYPPAPAHQHTLLPAAAPFPYNDAFAEAPARPPPAAPVSAPVAQQQPTHHQQQPPHQQQQQEPPRRRPGGRSDRYWAGVMRQHLVMLDRLITPGDPEWCDCECAPTSAYQNFGRHEMFLSLLLMTPLDGKMDDDDMRVWLERLMEEMHDIDRKQKTHDGKWYHISYSLSKVLHRCPRLVDSIDPITNDAPNTQSFVSILRKAVACCALGLSDDDRAPDVWRKIVRDSMAAHLYTPVENWQHEVDEASYDSALEAIKRAGVRWADRKSPLPRVAGNLPIPDGQPLSRLVNRIIGLMPLSFKFMRDTQGFQDLKDWFLAGRAETGYDTRFQEHLRHTSSDNVMVRMFTVPLGLYFRERESHQTFVLSVEMDRMMDTYNAKQEAREATQAT